MLNLALQTLLAQLAEPFTGEALFDAITNLTFFAKDHLGRYVLVNHTLAQRCGAKDKSALIGRTAAEVFPPPHGDGYLAQDLQLIANCEPLLNELELHTYLTGDPGWCITTKLPLKNSAGKCIGLVGISQDLYAPVDDYRDVAAALHVVQENLGTQWTVDEVARCAGLSPYQIDHRIREVFHLSTNQLILKFRMDLATQRLRDTAKSVAEIALECGYSDQSAFSRQFRRTVGLSPGDYRRLNRTA